MDSAAPSSMRVLVADDDARVRSALRLVLDEVPGLDVCGELDATRDLSTQVVQARPDVLVLDWEQRGVDGGAVLSSLRSACPQMRVVALASRPDARARALAAGADYFIAKTDSPDALLNCLSAVARSHLASAA